MKFAIISAGEGSRLAQEGVGLPKPLVRISGKAMIDRLVDIFVSNGAEEIVVVINNEIQMTKDHMAELKNRVSVPLRVIVKTTPSSMHSFYELSRYLRGGKFCLTTVDTIFREDEFSEYIRAFEETEKDGMMAVTDFIDDEKPLYVSTDEELRINGFLDSTDGNCRYISGGIYCLNDKAIDILEDCMSRGVSRMRNFQRELIAGGLNLEAYPFSKILDVDHASDIVKAEDFLNHIR